MESQPKNLEFRITLKIFNHVFLRIICESVNRQVIDHLPLIFRHSYKPEQKN